MTKDEAYKAWWHNEGSGIIPLPNEDMEEFAHYITQIAWSNGAFKEYEFYMQLFLDPENQPTQFGTATQEYREQEIRAEREAIIDIVAMYGGSVEIEAAIRARGEA